MSADLDHLRAIALKTAQETAPLKAIEKATTISKLVAKESKARSDVQNADKVLRVSKLQSILAGATTIISVVGLIATSLYNI
jgi:hypothetical protein